MPPPLKEVTVSEKERAREQEGGWAKEQTGPRSLKDRNSLEESAKICLQLGVLKTKVKKEGKRFHLKKSAP